MSRFVPGVWPGDPSLGNQRRLSRPCRYEAYVPDPLVDRPILLPPDVTEDLQTAEQSILDLNLRNPNVASLESVARLFLRAEAVASSKIEGLEVSARRLVRAEAAHALGQPARDITAEAVLGNIEAMQFAVEVLAERPQLTVRDILDTHRVLMSRTERPDLGGVIRTTQNWIGGYASNPCTADFVPPPPEDIPALLDDLVTYMNRDEHPTLLRAAMVHQQFETIHPFGDGNGRVGRALIHVILHRRGLAPRFVPPISLILSTHSKEYVAGLRAASYVGEPTSKEAIEGVAAWLRLFAFAAKRSAVDAEGFGRQIDDLEEDWRKRLGRVRADSAAELLLKALPAAPVITVATAARLIQRSVPQTNAAVNRLAQAGVVVPVRDVQRNRAYEAVGLLDAVTGFERALASATGDTRESPPIRRVPARPSHGCYHSGRPENGGCSVRAVVGQHAKVEGRRREQGLPRPATPARAAEAGGVG